MARVCWQHSTRHIARAYARANAIATPPTSRAAAIPSSSPAAVGAATNAPAVAVDVEYAHYSTADGEHVSYPAWVALVDQDCRLLVKTHIHQQKQAGKDAVWIGGVTPSACDSAPGLPQVLQQLRPLVAGQLLLGHGLAKDLAALGFLEHPMQLRFDTMTHPAFCNPAGNSRTLKQLTRQFLARDIQQALPPRQQQRQQQRQQSQNSQQQRRRQAQPPPLQQLGQQQLGQQAQLRQQDHAPGLHAPQPSASRHDPQEDAIAVMQLYQQVVFPSTYEGQVAAATARALAAMQGTRDDS